jgi:hypothetical protein
MNENEDLKLVFTGSTVEAIFLKSLLEESGIGALVRDTLTESVVAGWASGSPADAGLLFVSEVNEAEASRIIQDYLKNKP